MFAKLKEKIQKEGGTVGETEKPSFPGHASPRRTSLAGSPNPNAYNAPSLMDELSIVLNEDVNKAEIKTKEEAITLVQKRTDLCKKLESKLAEYRAVIKDNTKKIEKLEGFIEKQQDAVSRKSQELNEQYQISRAKLLETHKQELDEKEKEKNELLAKLKETESIKESFIKKEEEKEEMQEFTTQEMGKLRHMVILKEEELSKCQKQLNEVLLKCDHKEKQNKDLTNELNKLQGKLQTTETDRNQLHEESVGHGKLVTTLTKERMDLEESVTQLKMQLNEKNAEFASLQSKFGELESLHQTLTRNSELQKNKANSAQQEKDDQIEQLKERVKTLEQREQDQTLSGDERLTAIEKERDSLERKLTETREQLSQIKSSWSEKISHLEDQISHLNGKIVEDNEELTQAKQQTNTVKVTMQKEIDSLKDRIENYEKQCQDYEDKLGVKEATFKKEKLDLETEISKLKLEKIDLETQLRSKVDLLESQLMSMEILKAQEKGLLEDQLSKLQRVEKESEEKLDRREKKIEDLEEKNSKLQKDIKNLEDAKDRLQKEVKEKEEVITKANIHINTLTDELSTNTEKLKKVQEQSKSTSEELSHSNKEKDELMLRNAELSQQVTTLQRTSQEDRLALEQEKKALEEEIQSRIQAELLLQQESQDLQNKVSELTERNNSHISSSQQVSVLEENITALEEQLSDKNKALKKQEQKISDLKKTLQRELKVQSLPNDEPLDPKLSVVTPPLPRKNTAHREKHHVENSSRTRRLSSREQPPFPGDLYQDIPDSVKNGTQDYFLGQTMSPTSSVPYGVKSIRGVQNAHATIPVSDSHIGASKHEIGGLHGAQIRSRNDFRDLEKDVNFQYLKHVVMKFMLSRESEAIQLIKAVSLLLRFTPEEQKLIKDTLEWKMSWFGGSQPPALLKGHANKIVPPSY